MSFFPEIDRKAPELSQDWFLDDDRARRHGDESDLWLQELAIHVAASGVKGIEFLLSCVPNARESRLRAILLGLSSIKSKITARRRTEIWQVGLSLLDDPRPLVVAEAVDMLSFLECTDARQKVLELRSDRSPFVVGSVLRYMARHFPREALPLLQHALTSEEALVRQNAVDELDELNCVQALPTIRKLVRDRDRYVRQAARTAVKNLQGTGRNSKH